MDLNGALTMHGPVSVDYVGPTAVTLGDLSAGQGGGVASFLSQLWAVLLAWLAEALLPR